MEYHEQWPRKRSHDDLQSSKWLISAHKNKPLIKGGHRLEKIYIYKIFFTKDKCGEFSQFNNKMINNPVKNGQCF